MAVVQGRPVQQGGQVPPPPPPQYSNERPLAPKKLFFGPFDCFDDGNTCLQVLCCGCCAMAQIAEKLRICGGCKGIMALMITALIIAAVLVSMSLDVQLKYIEGGNMTEAEKTKLDQYDLFLSFVRTFVNIVVLSLACQARQMVKRAFRMPENQFEDCLLVFCCTPCVLCEAANNTKSKDKGLCGVPEVWTGPPPEWTPPSTVNYVTPVHVQPQQRYPTAQPVPDHKPAKSGTF